MLLLCLIIFSCIFRAHCADMNVDCPRHQLAELDEGCPKNWTRFQDSCYMSFDLFATWANAEKSCMAHGAHLASIWSTAENEFVRRMLHIDYHGGQLVNSSYWHAWIGLRDSEHGLAVSNWTDGTRANFTNFAPEFNPHGNCTMMYSCMMKQIGDQDPYVARASGEWLDWDCDTRMRQAICKKAIDLVNFASSLHKNGFIRLTLIMVLVALIFE